jgi:hypothetical protein
LEIIRTRIEFSIDPLLDSLKVLSTYKYEVLLWDEYEVPTSDNDVFFISRRAYLIGASVLRGPF